MKALVLLIALVTFACVAVPSFAAANEVTPEDLLMVTLSKADGPAVLGEPGGWWPSIPEFYGASFADSPGELFYISQSFGRTNCSDKRKIETALTLYSTDAAAKTAYQGMLDKQDKGATTVDGPSVADECRYYARTSDDRPYESALRFRAGRIVGRVCSVSGSSYGSTVALAKCAKPMVNRAQWLLAGKLKAKPVPADVAALLPPASVSEAVGPVLGTAVIPAECWAMIDSAKDPVAVRDKLYSLGVSSTVMRRYGVAKSPENVIEIQLFAFADDKQAAEWGRTMLTDGAAYESLDPGKTGRLSGFTYRKSISLYELTFTKDRFVADVSAWAPFGDVSPICESAVRKLAEGWYGHL